MQMWGSASIDASYQFYSCIEFLNLVIIIIRVLLRNVNSEMKNI
jgi:hypothetical protein